MSTTTKFWIGLGILGLLTPIGIFLPNHAQAGDAWGEWGIETVQKLVGYIPQGLKTLSNLWPAPFPDYALPGAAEKSIAVQSLEYVLAAIIGIAAVALVMVLLGKLLVKESQGQKTRQDFIERSIMGALSFLKNALFADEYALKRGFFQNLDPRIKLVSILLLLVLVLMAKSIQLLFLIYLFCLILVTFSSISLVYFLKRTWFFVPFFTIIIAVPALFSTITPGHPVWVGKFLGWDLIVTQQGIDSAGIFFMRVLTSVSLSILLILTTGHFVLLKVLRLFNLPQIFVMTLGMCYRYIYLFIEVVQNMYLAIRSRVGFIASSRKGQKVVAWNMAGLWWRSYQMQNDVYLAMVSRGYDGEPKVLDKFTVVGKDWGWLIVVIIIFIAGLCSTHFLN